MYEQDNFIGGFSHGPWSDTETAQINMESCDTEGFESDSI